MFIYIEAPVKNCLIRNAIFTFKKKYVNNFSGLLKRLVCETTLTRLKSRFF